MLAFAGQPYYDKVHFSKVFNEPRTYRIFLPANYDKSIQSYPVIYYFHGHSDRYTLEKYDNGLDTVPKIEAFVGSHNLIVVAVDGYVARDYTGFYGGTPYDVMQDGGDYDFGAYFLELAQHIDSTYRTLTDRRGRATSGLSMGGFMSLYLSARYPEMVGSASAFNPGPEFYVGEKGRRSLWRPKDHVLNHEKTTIRLIRASGDYISQYHEETRNAYAMTPTVDFEFRQDEYHRHWATSIAESFEFHMRAFANPGLDTTPVRWNYTSAFSRFTVWNYSVKADSTEPGLVYLQGVTQGGLRVTTRRWAPDGPSMHCSSIDITTGPVYASGASYQMIDFNLATAESNTRHLRADAEGRLNFHVNCEGHQVGFSGPGTGAEAPALLPLTDDQDVPRYLPGRLYSLPIRVVNMRSTPINKLRLELTSAYPTVHIARAKSEIQQIAPGKAADLSSDFQVRFTAGDGGFAHARLTLKMAYDNTHESSEQIDVLVAPDHMSAPLAVKVLDGREGKFPVFLQAREGGGSSIERTVVEGKGNGNGVLEPGERATVWLQHAQGLDPADKNNWCRAKIYFDSSSLKEVSDIEEQKGLEWTSAKNRTSVVELSYKAARREAVPVILDCESWSYHFTPDVRYGKELLYQPFQLHQHHLFSWSLETQSKDPFPATQLPGIVRPSAKGVNRPMPKPRKQSHATAADLPALQAELDDGERKIAAEEKRLKKQRLQAKANGSR